MDLESEFESKLKSFNIKYLFTLKMSERPSPIALKLGCSLVALYFEKLEKPIDTQEIYEINQGLNKELFAYYFEEPQKMFQEIKKSREALKNFQIPLANVRFVQLLIKDIKTEDFQKKTPVMLALKSIYEFLRVFIEIYFEKHKSSRQLGTSYNFWFWIERVLVESVKLDFAQIWLKQEFGEEEEIFTFSRIHQNKSNIRSMKKSIWTLNKSRDFHSIAEASKSKI